MTDSVISGIDASINDPRWQGEQLWPHRAPIRIDPVKSLDASCKPPPSKSEPEEQTASLPRARTVYLIIASDVTCPIADPLAECRSYCALWTVGVDRSHSGNHPGTAELWMTVSTKPALTATPGSDRFTPRSELSNPGARSPNQNRSISRLGKGNCQRYARESD